MAKSEPTNTTKSQLDDPAQSQRFKELAKEIGADSSEDALRKAVKRVAEHPPEPRRKLGKKATKSR